MRVQALCDYAIEFLYTYAQELHEGYGLILTKRKAWGSVKIESLPLGPTLVEVATRMLDKSLPLTPLSSSTLCNQKGLI
jgi:hypothetical protein